MGFLKRILTTRTLLALAAVAGIVTAIVTVLWWAGVKLPWLPDAAGPGIEVAPPRSVPSEEVYEPFSVPGYEELGVRWTAPADGRYIITIVGGAYSPVPTADYEPGPTGWFSTLYIYMDRDVEWDVRPESGLVGPVDPDKIIGSGDMRDTQADAERDAKGMQQVIDMIRGGYLVFVAIDERGFYDTPGINRGEVTISVELMR